MTRGLDPAAYDAILRYGPGALAWEVLRRDPEYHAAYAELRVPPVQAVAADADFTARWGLHFR
ncbi:transcriptional regulator domain-containing protein [Sphingopyxis sp. MC1]|uniref:transcriptional regulator domain-containing protein n=1 Tax=Sphingopyxis sp. MC1 TaxID=1174684 RepID=UPI003FA47854